MIPDILSEKTKAKLLYWFSQREEIQHFALAHYNELIERPAVHVLYGPSCSKAGTALPSSRLVNPRNQVLSLKSRGKNKNIYYLDENWEIIRVDQVIEGRIDATVLFFPYQDTIYGQPFSGNHGTLYGLSQAELYGITSTGEDQCVFIVNANNIYAEYYRPIIDCNDEPMRECTWYRYVPSESLPHGVPVLPGRVFSPLQCGVEIFPPFLADFRRMVK